jgi:outer membrane protein OmpA-like peptidoglycan-associated protein
MSKKMMMAVIHPAATDAAAAGLARHRTGVAVALLAGVSLLTLALLAVLAPVLAQQPLTKAQIEEEERKKKQQQQQQQQQQKPPPPPPAAKATPPPAPPAVKPAPPPQSVQPLPRPGGLQQPQPQIVAPVPKPGTAPPPVQQKVISVPPPGTPPPGALPPAGTAKLPPPTGSPPPAATSKLPPPTGLPPAQSPAVIKPGPGLATPQATTPPPLPKGGIPPAQSPAVIKPGPGLATPQGTTPPPLPKGGTPPPSGPAVQKSGPAPVAPAVVAPATGTQVPGKPGLPGTTPPGTPPAGQAAAPAGAAALKGAAASTTPPPPPGTAAVGKVVAPPPGPVKIEEIKAARQTSTDAQGRSITVEPGARTIIRQDNRVVVHRNETTVIQNFYPGARSVQKSGGITETFYVRADGVRVYSEVDGAGRLVRRYGLLPGGREVVYVDNRRFYRNAAVGIGIGAIIGAGIALALAPPVHAIPRERYVVEYARVSDDVLYETISAPPVVRLERAYSLDEVRYSKPLRDRMRSIELDTINFESGSVTIAEDQYPALERMARVIARLIERNPAEMVLIEGHSDAVGPTEDNLSLSDRRAEAVARVLVEYFSIPLENLVTQGYGEQHLKVDTQGPERANRRVVLRRIGPLLSGG